MSAAGPDYLDAILSRKRREAARRRARLAPLQGLMRDAGRSERAVPDVLRRSAADVPCVIAEVKYRSPSAGVLRERRVGSATRIAQSYVDAGAAVISVLADRRAFGGSVLDVRRVAQATGAPVLFKDFVLDEAQVRFARVAGASFVLLIVRTLEQSALKGLVDCARSLGLEPVVEAVDEKEVERALEVGAAIVGVNARDLGSFRIDPVAAQRAVEAIPVDRVAVYMSGVATRDDFLRIAEGRADAVLIGSALMRAPDPGARLASILGRKR